MLFTLLNSLLADISESRGLHLDPPDDMLMSWVLTEGPKLDTQVLQFIEGTRLEQPEIPEWLMPLWTPFVEKDDVEALRDLRQVLVFCYKAEYAPTQEQISDAETRFEACDEAVGLWDEWFSTRQDLRYFDYARQLVGQVTHKIDWLKITPSHGPGAVFPPCRPSEKSNFTTMYTPLQRWYPWDSNFCALPSFWWQNMVEGDSRINVENEIRCRLIPVPKDSRGPRLICVHPKEAIWVQQGQRRKLEQAINRHPSTRGKINFHDQTVNGKLALSASLTGEYCTLDLKDASDRMSRKLVEYLFGISFEYLDVSRATEVVLSSGRVLKLRKFAPMGNCLTFPIQSLVFLSLVRAGIAYRYGVIHCNDVYVFGDDIIFPTKFYEGAVEALVMAGFVPNTTKTFRRGLFRESCGVEAYRGIDITPLRLRRQELISVSDAVSLCDLAKRLRRGRKEHCASKIYSLVRKWLRRTKGYDLPLTCDADTQGLNEWVPRARDVWLYGRVRYSTDRQVWQSRVLLVRDATISVVNGDWYHLQDSLLRLEGAEVGDRCTEYAVPHRTRLVCGWTDLHT